MKYLISFFTILILIISNRISAQSIEPSDTSMSETIIVHDYDWVFRNWIETKRMLKINVTGMLPNSLYGYKSKWFNDVAFEHRVSNSGSLQLGLTWNHTLGQNYSIDEYLPPQLSAQLSYRYYLKNRAQKIFGLSKTNLSGIYIGPKISFGAYTDFYVEHQIFRIGIEGGIQKRIFNHSYIQLNFDAGIQNQTFGSKIAFFLEPRLQAGLVFGDNNKKENQLCKLFNCSYEKRRLLKLDLLGFFNGTFDHIFPSVIFEQKIFSPAHSINFGIHAGQYQPLLVFPQTENPQPEWYKSKSVSFSVEPRWYYNLESRILKGKTVNNFSASFVSLAYIAQFTENTLLQDISRAFAIQRTDHRVAMLWGLQRHILNWGFIEFKAGIENSSSFSRYDSPTDANTFSNSTGFSSKLMIGIAL